MHVRIFSLFAVLLAAAVVVGGSGAGTAKTRTATKIDVSTRSAVIHYLRSIHVNPRGVVIQRGARRQEQLQLLDSELRRRSGGRGRSGQAE